MIKLSAFLTIALLAGRSLFVTGAAMERKIVEDFFLEKGKVVGFVSPALYGAKVTRTLLHQERPTPILTNSLQLRAFRKIFLFRRPLRRRIRLSYCEPIESIRIPTGSLFKDNQEQHTYRNEPVNRVLNHKRGMSSAHSRSIHSYQLHLIRNGILSSQPIEIEESRDSLFPGHLLPEYSY